MILNDDHDIDVIMNVRDVEGEECGLFEMVIIESPLRAGASSQNSTVSLPRVEPSYAAGSRDSADRNAVITWD
jgi:hypothetical protein